MKNIMTNFGVILFASLILTSCGRNSSKEATTSKEDNSVDICKCITEPGNSEWAKNNKDACRDAISKEIGVDNWEKVNMSKNPDISKKFDALAERCIESIESSGGVRFIGSQVWTSKNLDVTTYRNGDIIPQVQDAKAWELLIDGAWCYYDNDTSNGTKYGKLYNWYAVNDPRGLAPKGFHIPTHDEWTILIDNLGGEYRATGISMKSNSGWSDRENGNNNSGFSAFPGGFRNDDGAFRAIGSYASWWSSENTWQIITFDRVTHSWDWGKTYGFSVRCIKD